MVLNRAFRMRNRPETEIFVAQVHVLCLTVIYQINDIWNKSDHFGVIVANRRWCGRLRVSKISPDSRPAI
jgi:hypothetical protein